MSKHLELYKKSNNNEGLMKTYFMEVIIRLVR